MAWTQSCGLVLVLVGGCTRPNLAFDGNEGDGDGDGDEAEEGEPTTSIGSTSGGVSTVGDGPATTTSATTEGTSDPDGGSVEDTGITSSGALDMGVACELELRDPFGIVSEPSWESVTGGCPPVATLYVQNQGVADGVITGAQCSAECSCGKEPITLTFEGPLPEVVPSCFQLQVELAEVEGACVVMAYRLANWGVEAPVVVASNVEAPLFPQPIVLELATDPVEECNNDCTPASGLYELITAMGVSLPPTNVSALVPVGGGQYRVANDRSGVDTECVPQVRWTAVQDF